jgi:hypothetical protein
MFDRRTSYASDFDDTKVIYSHEKSSGVISIPFLYRRVLSLNTN